MLPTVILKANIMSYVTIPNTLEMVMCGSSRLTLVHDLFTRFANRKSGESIECEVVLYEV